MKKCLRTGKKTLSVFMAVLMAITAMVFVAPQKTAAADGEAVGHVHDFHGTETIIKDATCTLDGEKTVKCINCDETETQVIPKTGHSYVAKESVAPTCTSSGYDVMVCQNDATHTYNRYDASKPAKGHTWSEWKVVTASTNDTAGLMKRTCTVAGCGAEETAEIPAGNHVFAAAGKVVKEATCKENGLIEFTCTAHVDANGNNTCGVKITVESEKKAHTYKTEVVTANCHQEGSIITKCTVCGEVLYKEVTEKTSHRWSNWTVTKEPTCDKDNGEGLKVRVCELCGDKEEEVIPKLADHDYAKTVVPATCTERGYTMFTCKRCDVWYRDLFTPALGHDFDEGVYEAPTCTTPGRIKYTCKRVLEGVACDYFYYDEIDGEPATGHSFSEWEYVTHPTAKNAFAKKRECLNGGCTYWEYEAGEGESADKGVNVYYRVNFFNEWKTAEFETLSDHRMTIDPATYTKLAKTYKTETLATLYVLKGSEAVYPVKGEPVRDKDRDYGAYTFEGWTTKKGQSALDKDKDAYPAETADLSSITANTDFYALFRCKDVYYHVRFVNADGTPITKVLDVLHGHSVEYPEAIGTPTLADNVYYKYSFKGWAYNPKTVYDSTAIFAEYNATAKKYVIVYHDWNGVELGREEISYGQKAVNVPEVKERPEDSTYIYKFLNEWTLVTGVSVNLNAFTASISDSTPEGTEINIYAKHSQRMKVYKLQLIVLDPYNQNLAGANIQITDSKGQLVATAKTDDLGVADISLNYSTVYGIKISRGNYAFEGTFTYANEGTMKIYPTEGERSYQGIVTLKDYTGSDMPVDENCKCICHTFLGGLWISVLNILYSVFRVKHVCCYDMFIVHGDKLKYGPNS
ncbi:MAG: hypothetical protein Q4D20_03400 [Clostridia bacterium]|nr:hypothetical protein [Clostridia bacterium]